MKKILRYFTIVPALAALLLCGSCNWTTDTSTNEQNFSFDTGEMTYLGAVDDDDTTKGSMWEIHMYTEGDIEAYFVLVTEYNEEYVPAGTYTNATTMNPLKIGTYLPGSADATGTPQYTYVITGTDSQYIYYSVLDNGTAKLGREVTYSEKGEKIVTYTMTSSFQLNNTIIYVNFDGTIEEDPLYDD